MFENLVIWPGLADISQRSDLNSLPDFNGHESNKLVEAIDF
jgi:hypothetical protein